MEKRKKNVIDVQQEMIATLMAKNQLLAVVHSTKASLQSVTTRAMTLDEERQMLQAKLEQKKQEREIATKHDDTTFSSIDAVKEDIDVYINKLDQKVTRLNERITKLDSEIIELRNKEEHHKTELREKESSLEELENKFESLEKQYSFMVDGKWNFVDYYCYYVLVFIEESEVLINKGEQTGMYMHGIIITFYLVQLSR